MGGNLIEVTRRQRQEEDGTVRIEVDVDYGFWKVLGLVYTSALFIGLVSRFVLVAKADATKREG